MITKPLKNTPLHKALLTCLILLLIGWLSILNAQGFLHTKGKQILNGNEENIILKGIGTGNWMIQEGYMMRSAGIAGTQHEFRQKLIETIGLERTDEFYESWLENHFTKTDVDSMAAWGFNSIRVALHYKWFTLPIEDEPIPGEHTWLDKGFEITDNLLGWCAENNMYLILDLHGAPGGQGKNADISDYDPNKPALWESEKNKAKTVALWRKLAERYRDMEWIGGYDLINEVNWTFPSGNNQELRQLYIRITDTIRAVDQNHIIFIEGNGFANDFRDLTPPWDTNMVYSFHKYWTFNDASSLDWVIDLRDQHNIPLWLGEAGENSNTWFTNLIELSEENNIGWSWWPVKKTGINNILKVEVNPQYDALIDMWRGNGSMTADQASQAVLQFSENHRFENCQIRYDVIDAMIRQPHTLETKPFKGHRIGEPIFAVDYDLGRNNYAYFDMDSADYHLNTNEYQAWNAGWEYRSDGVDIEVCDDPETNQGYSVGWIEPDEWLQYTLNNTEKAVYRLKFRAASEDPFTLHIEVNGRIASRSIEFPSSGHIDTWKDYEIEEVIIPSGEVKIRLFFETGGFNLNYFLLTDPRSTYDIPFEILSAESDKVFNKVFVNFNKAIISPLDSILVSDFLIINNNSLATISALSLAENNPQKLIIHTTEDLFSSDNLRITYRGYSVAAENQNLDNFTAFPIRNNYYPEADLPGKIEAEDFFLNRGFQLENCSDYGGGRNLAYADNGDYADYLVNFSKSGNYKIEFRVAAKSGSPDIILMKSEGEKMVPFKVVRFTATGDWQNWETQSTEADFVAGKTVFRIHSRNGEHNLNWFSFSLNTQVTSLEQESLIRVFPNPTTDSLNIWFPNAENRQISIFSVSGKRMIKINSSETSLNINTRSWSAGSYILYYTGKDYRESRNIIIVR